MVQIKLLIEGGKMAPGPALSQKLGPMGINMGQVIAKVNEATSDFKGLKVPVELDVDAATKEFDVTVFSPPTSELLKKELGIKKGSGAQLTLTVANASIEQIITVAKTKMPNLLCNNLTTAVKSVVGTCVSLGVLVENKPASEIGYDIDEGIFDKEINEEKTETSEEKRKELDTHFSDVVAKQKEAQAAAEAEAAEAAEAAETTVEGTEEVTETTEEKA